MEQSSGCGSKWYTEEERSVAESLVELRYSKPAILKWACKRRRSAIQHNPLPLSLPPSSNDAEEEPPTAALKAETSSPASPLSFSPTESDEKPKNHRRKKPSLKRKIENYGTMIDELTKVKASLNQALEKVNLHKDELKAFNSKLKARKQELINNGSKSEGKNLHLESGGFHVNAWVNSCQNKGQKQLQMSNQPLMMLNNKEKANGSSSSLGQVNSNIAIPDLNLGPEESMRNINMNRIMAAQARQRRIQLFKLKNPIRNSKPHCACK